MKDNSNKPWRQQSKGFLYGEGDVTENKQYLEDRYELFKERGNGWWWGWTSLNCPIPELVPKLKELEILRRKKEEEEKEM